MRIARLSLAKVSVLGSILMGALSIPAMAAPDLAISTITYDAVGHRADVVVRNEGTSSVTQSYYIDLFVDPAGVPALGKYALPGLYVQMPAGLQPGKTILAQIPLSLGSDQHKLYAIADTDGYNTRDTKVPSNNETNRANNVYGPVAVGGTGKPDLSIQMVDTEPGSPDTGLFTVTVTNNGDVPINSPFYVDFFGDPNKAPRLGMWSHSYAMVRRLNAKSSATVNFPKPSYWGFAIVDTDNLISEQNEANNIVGPVKVMQAGAGDVDLSLYNITYDVGAGQFVVTIKNQGSANTMDLVSVDLFIDPEDSPVVGSAGTVVGNTEGPIGPGETAQIRIDYPLAPKAEPYRVWGIVNSTLAVPEPDSAVTNNVLGPKVFQVDQAAGPDLMVAGIEWEQSTGLAKVLVKNVGTQDVNNYFAISLFVDPAEGQDPKVGDTGSIVSLVPGLAKGQSVKVGIQTQFATAGAHSLVAIADTEGNVAGDLDLTNNVSQRYTVNADGQAKIPDIYATVSYDVTLQKAYVTLSNLGNGLASPFGVKLYVDDNPTALFALVDEIPAGETKNVSFDLLLDNGMHSLKAVADEDKVLPETNIANNVATINASGLYTGPDLVVTGIRYDRMNHVAYVKIKNQGAMIPIDYYQQAMAGGYDGFQVALWTNYDNAAPPKAGDSDYTLTVPWYNLASQSEVEVQIPLRLALPLGSYHMRAIVDNGRLIDEGKPVLGINETRDAQPEEQNNFKDVDILIKPLDAADIVITDVYYDNGYYVRLQNQSTVDITRDFYVDLFVDPGIVPTLGVMNNSASALVLDLARGESRDIKVTTKNSYGLGAGSHRVFAIVDTECVVPEFYDANNVAGPVTVTVQ